MPQPPGNPVDEAVKTVEQARRRVNTWSAEDRRSFANFMCGWSPAAVAAFDDQRMRHRRGERTPTPTRRACSHSNCGCKAATKEETQ